MPRSLRVPCAAAVAVAILVAGALLAGPPASACVPGGAFEVDGADVTGVEITLPGVLAMATTAADASPDSGGGPSGPPHHILPSLTGEARSPSDNSLPT